jgi:hypothetical protein
MEDLLRCPTQQYADAYRLDTGEHFNSQADRSPEGDSEAEAKPFS